MKCIVCGCDREIMIHGHYQCEECGKVTDGDCCQGEQVQNENTERVDTNFEASDY